MKNIVVTRLQIGSEDPFITSWAVDSITEAERLVRSYMIQEHEMSESLDLVSMLDLARTNHDEIWYIGAEGKQLIPTY